MKTTMNIEIGTNIKKWRKFRKLTQKNLASRIGKSSRLVQNYEAGEVTVPIDTLKTKTKEKNNE